MPRWRNERSHLIVLAALGLAGAGAGVAAGLAATSDGLVRAGAGAIGGVAGLLAAAWLGTIRERRSAADAAIAARAATLNPVVSEAKGSGVLELLLPTRPDAVSFRGRTADLAWLEKWLSEPGGRPVAVVTGNAGVGKTRLLTQFASMQPEPLVAGWLKEGQGAGAVSAFRACNAPGLILVDDADTRPDVLTLLTDLAVESEGRPLRALLTTRSSGFVERFAEELPYASQWILDANATPLLRIGPFGSSDDHLRWFGEAVHTYARAYGVPPPDIPSAVSSDTIASEPDVAILTLQARALLTVVDEKARRSKKVGLEVVPFDEVAAGLFAYERQRWHKVAQEPEWGLAGFARELQARAIAALMLQGAVDDEQAKAALRWVPDLEDAPKERLANIARWALRLFPRDGAGAIQMQPDMLAEWFVVTQLEQNPGLLPLLHQVPLPRIHAVLSLLARASEHMPLAGIYFQLVITSDVAGLVGAGLRAALTAAWPGQLVLDVGLSTAITAAQWSVGSLAELERQLPEDGVLPETRAAVLGAYADCIRKDGTRLDLASALVKHGVALGRLGSHEVALPVFDEAASLWRELAAADPGRRTELAVTLREHGALLQSLGRRDEAAAMLEEALALLRPMAADWVHTAEFATTLQTYVGILNTARRDHEALASADEAVALWRQLSAADPDQRPELASALHSRGVALTNLDRHHEAWTAKGEALTILRDLARANPVAHKPGLASALQVWAVTLNEVGQRKDALAAAREAVELWQELAAKDFPHYHLLGMTLQTVGVIQTGLGQLHEAVTTLMKALVFIDRAHLSARDDDYYRALTLHSLGIALSGLCRYEEAAATHAKALALKERLASTNPAMLPECAKSLLNLAGVHQRLHLYEEALAFYYQALGLYQDLAASNANLGYEMALTLGNHASCLAELGHRHEARTETVQAIALLDTLSHLHPGRFQDDRRGLSAQLRRLSDPWD